MLTHRFRERTEDDPDAGKPFTERRCHRHAVEHGVDSNTAQHLLLFDRNAKLVERGLDLRIHLVQAVQHLLLLRRGVIGDVLVVDGLVPEVVPGRLLHGLPQPEGLEPPLQKPLGLLLLRGDQADDLLGEPLRNGLGFDIREKAVLVLAVGELFDGLG